MEAAAARWKQRDSRHGDSRLQDSHYLQAAVRRGEDMRFGMLVLNNRVVLRLTEISVRWTMSSWMDAMTFAVEPIVVRAVRARSRR
jgi:hypothetical protein